MKSSRILPSWELEQASNNRDPIARVASGGRRDATELTIPSEPSDRRRQAISPRISTNSMGRPVVTRKREAAARADEGPRTYGGPLAKPLFEADSATLRTLKISSSAVRSPAPLLLRGNCRWVRRRRMTPVKSRREAIRARETCRVDSTLAGSSRHSLEYPPWPALTCRFARCTSPWGGAKRKPRP
jgi:hypothetical protein